MCRPGRYWNTFQTVVNQRTASARNAVARHALWSAATRRRFLSCSGNPSQFARWPDGAAEKKRGGEARSLECGDSSPLSFLQRQSVPYRSMARRLRGAKESGDESPHSEASRRVRSRSGKPSQIVRWPDDSSGQKKAVTSHRTPRPLAAFVFVAAVRRKSVNNRTPPQRRRAYGGAWCAALNVPFPVSSPVASGTSVGV